MWGAPNVGTIFTIIFLILDSSLIVGRIGPILQSISLASRAAGAIRLILEYEAPENGDDECIEHAAQPAKKRTRFSMHASAWQRERGFEMAEKIDKIVLKPGPVNSLILHKVTFQYPTRPEKVIDSISITFKMGKFNAVVGPSGAGKSTICSLLLRLYSPTNGNIYVNYLPLNSYDAKSIRSRFAFVQQHSTLFPGTILENIKLGFSDDKLKAMSEEETRDRCIRAARAANAWPFICNLSDGLDTTVTASSGYGDLSGGEKQRLCLARALVSDPEVLILDEPTASLDVANQKLFLSALETAQKQRQLTIIMITHRLETVLKADWIWVMKKGHVVEKGSPMDLLRKPKGMFRAMYKLQETEREDTDGAARNGVENLRHSDDFDEVPLLPDGRQIAVRIPDAPESALALFKFALKLSRPEMLFVILGLFGKPSYSSKVASS